MRLRPALGHDREIRWGAVRVTAAAKGEPQRETDLIRQREAVGGRDKGRKGERIRKGE